MIRPFFIARKAQNFRGLVFFFLVITTSVSQGNIEQAIADYSTALEIGPDSAATYYNRGVARKAIGDPKGAIDDYDKAISAAPRFALAYADR